MNALPLMIFALCVLVLAYRYYSAFLAARVAMLDDLRTTPAHTLKDGHNYDPTNKWVLFGHHFAAISGAGPLVGPVLAAQFGFLPGLLWLVIGAVLAGATHDFLILVASIRHKGRSLAEIARAEIGSVAGVVCAIAILFIIINALAGLGFVVVKALGGDEVTFPKGAALILEEGKTPTQAGAAHTTKGETIWHIPGPVKLQYPADTVSATASSYSLTIPEDFDLVVSANTKISKDNNGAVPLPAGARRLVRGSSWGVFTIACTIPIALLVGLWMYRIRRGKIFEASIIGAVAVLACTYLGSLIPGSSLERFFLLGKNETITALVIYGFFASVLPVWLLLCPRDYLSSFLKIGTVIALVGGVLVVNPKLYMPATTIFCAGGGPIITGKVFPFLFITIMCGAISGFHSLVSSGTTSKMIEKESHARFIGAGAMLMESLVGVVALIAACSLQPGDYFAINVDLNKQPEMQSSFTKMGPEAATFGEVKELRHFEESVREQLQGRSGGAVSLAVGMAKVFSEIPGANLLLSFWYHFAIMFEALFILTTIDAGTRIARFIIQEMAGRVYPTLGRTNWWPGAVIATALVVVAWGYFIWTGSIDTIWPMFGIANQLLAAIALCIATVMLINLGRTRYLWVTLLPLGFLMVTTLIAGWQLIFDKFLPAARAAKVADMQFKWGLNAALTAVMMACLLVIVVDSIRRVIKTRKTISQPMNSVR